MVKDTKEDTADAPCKRLLQDRLKVRPTFF